MQIASLKTISPAVKSTIAAEVAACFNIVSFLLDFPQLFRWNNE